MALRSALNPTQYGFVWDELTKFAEDIRRLAPTWQPIETAPVGKRILVKVPIDNHRLVIGLLTKEGIWLGEMMQPMAFVPPHWQALPAR